MSLIAKITNHLSKRAFIGRRLFVRNYSDKLSGATHKVNNLEKKFLVWTGKFKTTEEIPAYLAPEIVEKARNRLRIKIANIMMAATLLCCLIVAISGRKARDRGESVTKMNLEWHQKQNEENKEKQK